jgi:hypothetical protein
MALDNMTYVATPHEELIASLLNPNTPKSEREHAACEEIERLRKQITPDAAIPPTIKQDLEDLINRHGIDAACGIPDYVIAQYLMRQIKALYEAQRELAKSPQLPRVKERIFL